jgi:branched-chain amino acid transport system substrate-binding protein
VRRSQTAATWRELLFDPSGGRDLDRSVRFTTRFTLATIGAGLLLLTGCQKREGGAAGTGDINIGLAGAQSGADAQIGLSMLNGSRVAIDEWNAKGGVLGRKINPIVFDDEGKPDKAVNVAETLVDDNVVAVIGHFNSGCTIPASRVYNDAKVVEISPGSTNPQYTEQGFPYAFRICGRDDAQGSVAAAFLRDTLKLDKIAILDDKTSYGEGIANEVKKNFEAKGGQVVMFQGIGKDEKDFRANIDVIKGSGAQALFWGGMYGQGGPLYVQMHQAGLTIPFVSDDGAFDPAMIDTVGANAPDVYVTFGKDYHGKPGADAFIKKYNDTFHQAEGGYSVYGYDAANVLFTAMTKAGTTDADKVAAVMKGQPFDTILGRIEFNAKGDVKQAGYVIWTIKDGKFQVLNGNP